MRDKEIDDLLNEINDCIVYNVKKLLPNVLEDKEEIFKIIKISYLETELKLIKLIINSSEFQTYQLTRKGSNVLRSGGWNKYIKRKNKRKNISYIISVSVPIITSIIALLSITLNIQQNRYKEKDKEKEELLLKKMEEINYKVQTLQNLDNQKTLNDTLSKNKN